jgi:glycosyltransferase involved in cell wall biosynthesis
MNISYVRSAFPKMSETFILEELLYLKRCGHTLRIYATYCELEHLSPKVLAAGLLECVEYRIRAFRLGLPDVGLVLRFLLALLFNRQSRSLFQRRLYGERSAARMFDTLWRTVWASRETRRHRLAALMRLPGELVWTCTRLGNLQVAMHQATIRRTPFKPDLMHAPFLFENDVAWLAVLLKANPRTPLTVTLRSRDLYSESVSPDLMLMRKKLVAAARMVFTISSYNRRHILSTVRLRQPPKVIYSSIDVGYFTREPGRAPVSGQMLCVARLVEKKGLNVLIDACRELLNRECDFHLTMVGAGYLQQQLQQQCDRLGLQQRITFAGAVPPAQVKELLSTAQVFVLPCVVAADGDRDMLPNSIKEAMAMEVPVVTSNISGIEELVIHGATGLLAEPNNPTALADAIENLLLNPHACRAFGKFGALAARRKFDINIQGLALQNSFIDIAEQEREMSV